MRHKLLVLTVKKFLQSVYIYGSYRKVKTGVPFFLDQPVYRRRNPRDEVILPNAYQQRLYINLWFVMLLSS